MASTDRKLLTLETMEDDSGNRATVEVEGALQRVEDSIQSYLDRNDGEVPDGEWEVTLKMKVKPEGEVTRRLAWEVSIKQPKLTHTRVQKLRSRGGILETARPAGQRRLPMERMAPITEEQLVAAGESDDEAGDE